MPYIVPQPPRTIGNFESAVGGFDQLMQALLQTMLSGQLSRNIPNPGYGQTGSPGTTFSQPPPGQLSPPQNPQQIKQGFVPRTPASPFASQRMINTRQLGTLKDLQSLQTQKAQSALMNRRANQPPFDLQSLMSSQGGGNLPGNQASIYQIGDVIERDGQDYEVVGFDTDGTPLVEPR